MPLFEFIERVLDNEEEAEKLAVDMNVDFGMTIFCPLTNSNCRINCVCFTPANHYEINECLGHNNSDVGKYRVCPPYCNNHMFLGNDE
ncbi:MAG: hypothetical protein KAS32_02275 [Candidatus Peribacteraceae bacterium]|nr:hypothetical protein [Candidatus Peribacteraceae bacterium]